MRIQMPLRDFAADAMCERSAPEEAIVAKAGSKA
jgi:hypothetical protein